MSATTTATLDHDESNVPWGKYSYICEGLATACLLEGVDPTPRSNRPPSLGQRLRFRVELPARCFVLSVAVKLPNAPQVVLPCLEDIVIERALSHGDFEVVYDPSSLENKSTTTKFSSESNTQTSKSASDDSNNESPTSVDQTVSTPHQPLSRKKLMEVRRAADSLRITLTDIDDSSAPTTGRNPNDNDDGESDSDDAESDSSDQRTLGVVVIGYTRGQTPASNRLRILLNASSRLSSSNVVSKIDHAEIEALVGLAFLGSRRYRQAAEILQRAAEMNMDISKRNISNGLSEEETQSWAAQLNLLSAHAYFEHMAMCNDGIIRLIHVASAYNNPNNTQVITQRNTTDLHTDFLDIRTELLNMLESLIIMLVQFLSDSSSPAVRMAAARMIEFISDQLGCGMAPHMAVILNTVLRCYPSCVPFGARERAAASSFSYDSMEDCFERLTDICCRLFPLTEHTVLHRLYDNTLIPVFLDAFRESEYLSSEPEPDIAEDLISTSVAQTLRVIYLSLNVLGADARIPTSLISRLLNILVLENGYSRTSLILRRTALHTWDAVSQALIQSSCGNTVKAYEEQIKMLTSFLPKLLVETDRMEYDYRELEEDNYEDVQIFKEKELEPETEFEAVNALLKRRSLRVEVGDRHTLRRVVTLLTSLCESLNNDSNMNDEGMSHNEIVFNLQECVGKAIADLAMSSILDVSYHEATLCGNGAQDFNLTFEFGSIDQQLTVVSEVIEELFACYWACLRLLPSRMVVETVRTTPVRTWLGWCVERIKSAAPPQGMLKLLIVVVKGLINELNTCMFGASSDENNPSEVTYLSIYRAHLIWLIKTAHEETFELLDLLNDNVAGDILANDLLLLIHGLGDQRDEYQNQTESSLEALAKIIAAGAPKDPDLAIESLKNLQAESNKNQRLSKAFPKTGRNGGSFNKKVSTSLASRSRQQPMLKSFYLHVVLSSCFDRFDELIKVSQQRAGPSYMLDKIDAFVEHAAFVVRCLHVCVRSQAHREYVGEILGDIFGTCLAMEDHSDGRVRLAGFEIFGASLDVLFLAQKATMLRKQQTTLSTTDSSVITMPTTPTFGHSSSMENMNGLTDLSLHSDEDTNGAISNSTNNGTSSTIAIRSASTGDPFKAGQLSSMGSGGGSPRALPNGNGSSDEREHDSNGDDDKDGDQKMSEIMADGGSWEFQLEETTPDELAFEEKAWQMLCLFISSSLGVGRFVDFLVQRACLEYLRTCMMNALRGRSSGASVISFEHIEGIWEAVSRLVGSPWRALNSLAMWITCAVVNVSVYATVSKSKGAGRQRSTQLNDFITKRVFNCAESLLKSTSRESRIWGMQLLEVYVRSRDLNPNVLQVIPAAPGRILRCLHTLKNDWDVDIRSRSQALLEVHYNSLNRKTSNLNSFTQQAQNFMSIKRHMIDEFEAYDPSKVELWFPPLPKQLTDKEIRSYHLKLESFASVPIVSGEEINLVKTAEDKSEYEDEEDEEEEGDEYEVDGASTEQKEEQEVEGIKNEEKGEEQEQEEGVTVEDAVEDAGEDESDNNDEENVDSVSEEDKEEGDDEDPQGDEGSEEESTTNDDEIVEIENHVTVEDPSSSVKGDEAESPNSVISTEAEVDSEQMDELESPKEMPPAQPETIEGIVPYDEYKVSDTSPSETGAVHDEYVDADDDFDHEFPSPSALSEEQISKDDDNIADIDEVEDYVRVDDDDDDVVDVTDVDDVLMDLDSLSEPDKPQSPSPARPRPIEVPTANNRNSFANVSGKPKHGTASPRSPRANSSINVSSPAEKFNPDLDEGKILLRRTGSFTGRPPKSSIEEGDAPKLERRRSVDVGSFSAGISVKGKHEGEEVIPVTNLASGHGSKSASRLSKKKSTKSGTSPRPSDPAYKPKLPIQANIDKTEIISSGAELELAAPNASGSRLPRRKSMKNVVIGPSNDGEKIPAPIHSVAGKFGMISDVGEAEARPSFGSSPGFGAHPTAGSGGGKEKSGRSTRRSLPRAKAFVKGGGVGSSLQRRNSGPVVGSGGDGDVAPQPEGRSGGGGSSSSPSLTGGKARLPRGKSQTERGSAGLGKMIDVASEGLGDKRPDRSHRFSTREALPISLSLNGEVDEIDNDLLNDLEAKATGGWNSERSLAGKVDIAGGGKRSLTPTAEASPLGIKKSLIGDEVKEKPGSVYMRKGFKRDGSEPMQYRRLWDNGEGGSEKSIEDKDEKKEKE